MDLQRKTIQGLTVSLDEKREELSAFYHQFGTRLFSDSADPLTRGEAFGPERIDSWRSLMNSREADTQAILDIKAAVTRQQELFQFRRELERNTNEENGVYRTRLEELGRAFFGQYSDDDSGVFGETYAQASSEGNILIQLEEKQDKLRQEIEASGFFAKMVAQFRMAGITSNIRQHKSRIMKIFADGGEKLLRSGILDIKRDAGSLNDELSGIHSALLESTERMNELKKRGLTIESDLAAVSDRLVSFAAADNPVQRMDELRSRIKETDKRIDSLTILSAREYADKFLDESGSSLLGNTGDGHTFSDMGAYSHQLEQIAQYRSAIADIRNRVEALETAIRIESLDRNIVAYEKSVEDYERKIQQYRDLIESLRKNIRESGEERDALVAHKAEIERRLERTADPSPAE